jgi:hypothetical protein
MGGVFYLRIPATLSAGDDVRSLAVYWKKFYNTSKGDGRKRVRREFGERYWVPALS